MDALTASLKVAGSGLHAESTRLRVVSENIANASSTGDTPGADPYARKTIAFQSALDRASQVAMVEIDKIGVDRSAFVQEFEPSHPAADPDGYVKLPNVNPIVEMADMREANRSYQANLQVLKQARELISMTIDLMRGTLMIEQLQAVAGAGFARTDLTQTSQSAGADVRIDGTSFGEIMRDQIAASVSSVKGAESASIAGMQGQMDVRQVTDAVMEAERNLQAAVAIRDKIVTAYLDMTRMAI